ncbi:MAG: Rieske (2Fe-2S) protein [Microscillaceae bacterium]|nr:Rieske (2Fe-2S) protein [Microscillaceae bacterium]MDW8461528.1 Rieske (2Fe-2S) protein [Cytophagales bacterium]
MEKIFASWHDAIQKLPLNQPVARHIQQKKICLVRLSTNQIIAFKDACPHMGTSLSKGIITEKQAIVCPWHHYS